MLHPMSWQPGARTSRTTLGTVLVAALLLTGCEQSPPADDPAPATGDGTSATAEPPGTAPGPTGDGPTGDGPREPGPTREGDTATATATAYPPDSGATTAPEAAQDDRTEVSEEQVREVLVAMDEALQEGDVDAYLTHVAPDLKDDQRAWFQGVHAVPMSVRQLRLDGVVSRTGVEGTVAHVGLRHQITGGDPVPVLEQYRWVFTATGEQPPLLTASRGRNGEFYGFPQLWDLGEELAVLQGHSVLVVAQESRREEAETLVDTLDHAAEETLETLPWVAQGREKLVVQLVPAEVLEEIGWGMSTGGQLMLEISPQEITADASRLTGLKTPLQPRLLLDVDLALLDLEDYGSSPGGQTELRYFAAHAGAWGSDRDAWPEDWVLQGAAYWWSSVEDDSYHEQLLAAAGDHFAETGQPRSLPTAPLAMDDVAGGEAYTLESLALATYLEQTFGREALVGLLGELIPLDQRHDRAEITEAYTQVIGIDQHQLIQDWAAWTRTLPTTGEGVPPPEG